MATGQVVHFGADARPTYEPPSITTLNEDEILDQVGPAQAYTGSLPFNF